MKYLELNDGVLIDTEVTGGDGVLPHFIGDKHHGWIFFAVIQQNNKESAQATIHHDLYRAVAVALLLAFSIKHLRRSLGRIWAVKTNVPTRVEKPIVFSGSKVKCVQKHHRVVQIISIDNEVINDPDLFFFT